MNWRSLQKSYPKQIFHESLKNVAQTPRHYNKGGLANNFQIKHLSRKHATGYADNGCMIPSKPLNMGLTG